MELKKFRIKNFKSIKDTGEKYIDPKITIFAGKNESGKTSLLEALAEFGSREKIPEKFNRLNSAEQPQIMIWFKVSEEEINNIIENILIDSDYEESEEAKDELKKILLVKNEFLITKKHDGSFLLDEDLINSVKIKHNELVKNFLSSISKDYNSLKNNENLNTKIDFSNINLKKSTIADIEQLLINIEKVINPTEKVTVTNPDATTTTKEEPVASGIEEPEINSIKETLSNIRGIKPDIYGYQDIEDFINDLTENILDYVPKMIFLSSFEDELVFHCPIDKMEEYKINMDLLRMAEVDIQKVKGYSDSEDDLQARGIYLDGRSAEISTNFKNIWRQDKINFNFKDMKDIIQFGIKEEENINCYKPKQRSRGLQWFLEFYIRLNSQNADNKVILIDEPGLYLHAKAQEDILKHFEELCKKDKNTKIIFSTHSPYLIDIENLGRVLLIEKNNKNETIIEKSHTGARTETFTPILTKMGFDIAKSAMIKNKNILTEGISDYYYLNAFKKITGFEEILKDIAIIPSVGASKIPQLASLCAGWGIDYVAVFDKDSESRNVLKEMENLYDFNKSIVICEEENCSIEDLFSRNDFNNLISETGKQNQNSRNSVFIKENNIQKVLFAKKFYDQTKKSIKDLTLSKETKDNFKKLFENICDKLEIKLIKNKQK